MKGSKKIIAACDTTGLFDRITRDLFSQGFTFETSNRSLGLISTGPLSMNKWTASRKVRVMFTDTGLVFTSQAKIDVKIFDTEMTYTDVDYSGAKHSANREAWEELKSLALKYSNKIVYSK